MVRLLATVSCPASGDLQYQEESRDNRAVRTTTKSNGTTMMASSPAMTVRTIALGLLACVSVVCSLPIQLTINQRGTECLYDKLEEGEHVTMSVFILSGAVLKATATLEGPVAPPDVDSGTALLDATERFRRGERFGDHLIAEEVVDFEHLQEDIREDDVEEDEEEPPEGEDPVGRRARIQRNRERAKQRRTKELARKVKVQQKIRSAGEPYQVTTQAKSAGWYRACVRGTWYQIVAELEMRKSSDLGLDNQNRHVNTYEDHTLDEQERIMKEDTASQEVGVNDADFEETRSLLNKLRRLLNEIEKKQTSERHRLMVHKATNEHSHSRMVLNSLLETVLYMAVTGYQVYTIRKWFSGAPVLGR